MEIHSGLGIPVENVSITLDGHHILNDISVVAESGKVTALVGPNGVGESTLLAALSGDHELSGGDVRIGKHSITELSTADLARYRVVLVQSQELSVPFTSRDVIDFGCNPWGCPNEKLLAEVIAECDVAHLLNREVPTLSGGEHARIHNARVFYQGTLVVLLDEPTAALDLHHAEKIMGMIRVHAAVGKAVVVVLHDLSAAAACADHIVVVAQGRVVKQGPPAETLDAQTVSEVYDIGVEVLRDSAGNPVLVPQCGQYLSPQSPKTPQGKKTTIVESAIRESNKLAAQPLAKRLKVETSGARSKVENSDFMSRLLAGELDAQAAIDLAGQLYFVYEMLEQAVRSTAESERVSAVYDAQLERLEALATDLEHLVGSDWREKVSPVEATKNYMAELREIESNGNANATLAHHYVRYLGDPSGGQVIASMLAKHYGTNAGGTRFYDFSAIGKIKPYRNGYRRSLSELSISDADKDAAVGEAKKAFRLNQAIFHDLASGLDDAMA